VPLVVGKVEESAVVVDPCAVDEDVDSAPTLLGRCDRGVDAGGIGDVGRVRPCVAAAGDDRVGDAVDLGGGTGNEQDVRALVGEPPRGRLADPAPSPGDERPLSREPSHRPPGKTFAQLYEALPTSVKRASQRLRIDASDSAGDLDVPLVPRAELLGHAYRRPVLGTDQ